MDPMLLIEAWSAPDWPGRRVLDLCTGSGVVAISAAAMGASSVTAFDICPHAVRCSRDNAAGAGVTSTCAKDRGRVPWTTLRSSHCLQSALCANAIGRRYEWIPPSAGPARAWNAGLDGRAVLDPLCSSAAELLADGGSLLLVHSALAGVERVTEISCASPAWTQTSLPHNRFLSGRCYRRGLRGWSARVRSSQAVAQRN